MIDDRVTVFIPVSHFHEEYLRQAADSVFAQTREDWALLLVVHPDQKARVSEVLASRLTDARVRMIPTQGRNLAGAYNTAMRSTETTFITPLLGDDLFARDAVRVLGESIRTNPDVDFLHSGRYFVDGAGRRLSSDYMPERPVTPESFWRGSPVKHLYCWRASRGLACGGVDESLENFGSDDYDFPWTMLEHGALFISIPKALYIVRDHRDGFRLTTHLPRDTQIDGLRRILSKHGVPERAIRKSISKARRGYLRQSLFRNALHRWLRERVGFDARRGWRQPYR